MKTKFTFFIFLLLLFSIQGTHAQTGLFGESSIPLKPQSALFGKDIIIYDSLNVDQEDVAVCSAFNGWLYAVVTYYDSIINNMPGFSLMRSTDSGITWTFLYGGIYPANSVKFRSNKLVVLGDSLSNLKVFWSTMYSASSSGLGQAFIWRFNGVTGAYEAQLYNYNSQCGIAIASDYNYPASTSAHPTLGMVCSTPTQITFYSSSNGGMSFDNTKVVATTSNSYFHKVALNYGRSPSWSTGRYFAVWEAQAGQTSTIGHIYTAHSEPDFNSAFTKPVCIDSVDPSTINKVRNPVIACQFNSADNDSSNLTEVIMSEKQLSANSYDIQGFYNLQATTSNHFNTFSISSSSDNNTQPDINFNPYNSTFMLTYYDATTQGLPFLTNNVNLANPDSWNIVTNAYNDNTNLVSPIPRVSLDYQEQQGMNVWISKGTNNNGIALFDSPYRTYTGISGNNKTHDSQSFRLYPNPCNSDITISFELENTEKVTISICNIVGQSEGIITDQNYPSGKHQLKSNVSNLSPGSYICTFKAGDILTSGKLTVIR
jgi:hypothetical protein